jgi:hypothetical protein
MINLRDTMIMARSVAIVRIRMMAMIALTGCVSAG